MLSDIASISRLFSTSDKPYLDYRIAENVFCEIFGATNVSRSCVAIDAKLDNVGIGIKTFVNAPIQKIAEFDKERDVLNGDPMHDAIEISKLRNVRLDFARDAYGVDTFIYHYIVRSDNRLQIFEEPMDYIDIDKIQITKSSSGSFQFTDGKNEYTFSKSKSTLLKRFHLDNPLAERGVEFIDDPISALFGESGLIHKGSLTIDAEEEPPSVILPLFSFTQKRGRFVPEKSGLNQWNAAGRKRNMDEVYIPLHQKTKNENPDFFPPRYEAFKLRLPDGTELSASVCQDNGKAIMSNPNKALGHWLLRTVLHMKDGELATMEKLNELGINAVIITKYPDRYEMDFTYIGDDPADVEQD